MGYNDFKSILKRDDDKKPKNLIVLVLAFIIGAVTAAAAVWRVRVSKDKRDTGTSDGESAQTNRELKKLIKELRSENERRQREEHAAREKESPADGTWGNGNLPPAQIKPYIPRKRLSVKRILVRATAVFVAAALVVTGIYLAPYDKAPAPAVQARESFGGIKQVVEEHDSEHPFVILDIVPGKAYAAVNGKEYEFSLGTIGYLAPGQSPIQQDLARILTGADRDSFYSYAARKELVSQVMGSSYDGINYREAYEGTENLNGGWSRLFDKVSAAPDENGDLPEGSFPTGRLWAGVEKRPANAGSGPLAGYDYNWVGQSAGGEPFDSFDSYIS